MKLTRIFSLLGLLLGLIFEAYSQNSADWKLTTQPQEFRIQERALLVLDNDFYLVGESIHFFASTYDLALQIPIDFSSILYVELLSQDNLVCSAQKFKIGKGEVVNKLVIPKNLETGYYYIRAYTNYMKNFGPSTFAFQKIKIVNPFKKANEFFRGVQQDETKVQVFAEGGKILTGVDTKLIVRSSNWNARMQAVLFENDSVLTQTTITDGMGVLNFKPSHKRLYRMETTDSNGRTTNVTLPEVEESGVVCSLDRVDHGRAFLRIETQNFEKFPLSVFVQSNGFEYAYSNPIRMPSTAMQIQLPMGLSDVVVKDSENHIVSVRTVYNGADEELQLSAQLNQSVVAPNDTIAIHLKSNNRDSLHCLVAMNFDLPNNSQLIPERMATSTLLSSIALRTNQIPESGLIHIAKDLQRLNDFTCTLQYLENTTFPESDIQFLPEIGTDLVTGSIIRNRNQDPAPQKDVYLSFVDSIAWLNRCRTDRLGKFVCSVPLAYQGNDLVVTVPDTTEAFSVKLDNEFYPEFLEIEPESFSPDSTLRSAIEARMINLQINDAYYGQQEPKVEGRPQLRSYGTPSVEYQFRKYIKLPNLDEFFYEVAVEVIKVKNRTNVEYKIRDLSGPEGPLVLFDGVPLLETDGLAEIPCNVLETMRIVSQTFYWGSTIYNGVIDITSVNKSYPSKYANSNSTRVLFSPVLFESRTLFEVNERLPRYLTSVYFNVINAPTGETDLKIQMPQNKGDLKVQILGFRKDGQWGAYAEPLRVTCN